MTDSSGVVQTEYTYQPFGETTVSGSSNGNPSQYTGRDNDGTGLYYYRGRYYSPALHRFISEDPIGVAGGVNLYGYVGNNPISYTDPYGLDKNGNPDRNPNNPDCADPIQLCKFVDMGKDNLKNVMNGAGAEALGPAMGAVAGGIGRGLKDILADDALFSRFLKHKFPAEKPFSVDDSKKIWDELVRRGLNPRLDAGHPGTQWPGPHINVPGRSVSHTC